LYWWEGRVCDEPEIAFTAKTTAFLFDELVAEVKRLHSYTVPEIVFVPVTASSPDYQRWLSEVTK
jgi:periplasmic divalent cation tolerance protein